MPAALTALAHLSVSLTTKAPSSSGVSGAAMPPVLRMFSSIAGLARPVRIMPASLSMIGRGVPAGATAITVSITATGATGTGYVVAYPGDTSKPGSRSVSFVKGVNITGDSTTGLGPNANSEFRIYASQATQVLVDVTGYYTAPMAAFVAQDGTLTFATSRVTAAAHLTTGNYTVTFDRDVSACGYTATLAAPTSVSPEQVGVISVSAFTADPAAVNVRTRELDGTPAARGFTVQVWC